MPESARRKVNAMSSLKDANAMRAGWVETAILRGVQTIAVDMVHATMSLASAAALRDGERRIVVDDLLNRHGITPAREVPSIQRNGALCHPNSINVQMANGSRQSDYPGTQPRRA